MIVPFQRHNAFFEGRFKQSHRIIKILTGAITVMAGMLRVDSDFSLLRLCAVSDK